MHGTIGRNIVPTTRRRFDFAWLVRWWRAYALARESARALDGLNDDALRDIGLSRSDIPRIAATANGTIGQSGEKRIIPSRYY